MLESLQYTQSAPVTVRGLGVAPGALSGKAD